MGIVSWLLVIMCICLFLNVKFKSKHIKILNNKNSLLDEEISSLKDKLSISYLNNQKLAVEYLTLQDMWKKLESYTISLAKKLGNSNINIDEFGDSENDEPKTIPYNIDDILDEMNKVGGFKNLTKDKQDFLSNCK